MKTQLWWLWGLGWLFMPRMTIGIILFTFSSYETIGLVLAIIGGIIDVLEK